MKINWFSPLPPAPSDIAGYTARLLPALTARADVTLWTAQERWDDELERLAPVRQFNPSDVAWEDANAADATFYNLGNDAAHHGAIWRVSRVCPGLVILHDLRLHHFFDVLYHLDGDGGRGEYLAVMRRFYGPPGREDAERVWARRLPLEEASVRYPLTQLGVEGAIGIVAHTPAVGDVADLPLTVLPLPYPATDSPQAQRRSAPPYQVVAVGYMGANRRLEQFLDAWAGLPQRDAFRFDVYGRVADRDGFLDRVRRLRLDDLVTVHGFVPEGELEAALRSADLAVNLRYPTMGEASGSQLRLWDHALPTLVTQVGWYATLPPESTCAVRPEHEAHDIQQHLQQFLQDPAAYASIGRTGRRVLRERHSPETYASALVGLAAGVDRLHVRAAALALAERSGRELARWTGSSTAAVAARNTSEAVLGLMSG